MNMSFNSDGYQFFGQVNRKVSFNAGLIIYPDNDKIPQDVLFIPYERDFALPFKEDVKQALNIHQGLTLITYFQGLRWYTKNLEIVLSGLPYITARMTGHPVIVNGAIHEGENVRLSFGIIVSDISFNKHLSESDDRIHEVQLISDNRVYDLECMDVPRSFGVPGYFTHYNPENYFLYRDGSWAENSIE